MRAIMYHYVQEYSESYPNFRFLHIDNFRKQLDFFAQEFGFVTRREWNGCLQNKDLASVQGKVLLTFDDAMACHYDYVFPELVSRGLWGIFYVPTKPYLDSCVLDVHKIHLLCGRFDGQDLLSVARSLITEEMVPFAKRGEFRNMTYVNQENYYGISEFKRLLNYFIDETVRTQVIDKIAAHFSYKFDASGFYVSPNDLKIMHDNGMVIGSHSDSHPVMSKLTREQQQAELTRSRDFLSSLGIFTEKTYCHPYGGFWSFNEDTVALLDSLNIAYSFNVESRQINTDDLINCQQYLPRFDCNEFPYGKAS